MKNVALAAPLLLVSALACAPAEPGRDGFVSTSQDLDTPNGDNLNGDNLNGDNLNGPGLGTHVVSVNFDGAATVEAPMDRVWIEGSELRGERAGESLEAAGLRDARFHGTSDTGADVLLRVASVDREDDDSWLYGVEFLDPTQGRWLGLCRDSTGANRPAYAVNGYWNPQRGVPGGGAKIVDGAHFTFACRGLGAIGKCISPIGYRPWRSVNGVSLDRYHQACVRMIRADFCGDGTPYTVQGQHVNVYDDLGVQQDTEDWLYEAEWDENGARCFNALNRSHGVVPCQVAKGACVSFPNFSGGALIVDETMCGVPDSGLCTY